MCLSLFVSACFSGAVAFSTFVVFGQSPAIKFSKAHGGFLADGWRVRDIRTRDRLNLG
jgi:hypothetical protein